MSCIYAYYNPAPIIWLAGLALAVLLSVALTKKRGPVAAIILITCLSWTAVFWIQDWLFVDVVIIQRHQMTWMTDGPPLDRVTTFRYIADPSFYELCRSNDVANWLDSQQPSKVEMLVETRWSYGKLHAAGNNRLVLNGKKLTYQWLDRPPPWHLFSSSE